MSRIFDIRIEILDQLYSRRPASLDAARMVKNAMREQVFVALAEAEIAREADYLIGKNYIELDEGGASEIAKGQKRWKITAAGIDYLEREGLI